MAEYKPGLTAGPNAVPSTLSGEPWPRNFRQRQGQLRSLEASHVKGHQDANVKNPQDEAMGMTKGGATQRFTLWSMRWGMLSNLILRQARAMTQPMPPK
jgi:hypothetical protein